MVITIEGRFITWIVAVTCCQLQLNLRGAVYHVPDYVASYYSQPPTQLIASRPPRPGVETLIFGGTATELERKYHESAEASHSGGEDPDYSHAIELVTTSVHVSRGATGKKKKIISPSADLGGGKRASLLPKQLRRASSFQGSPSHSPWQSVDVMVTKHAATDDMLPLSPSSATHSEPTSKPATRATTPSSRNNRTALGFDMKHNWALARPNSSSSAVANSASNSTPSPGRPTKQYSDSSQVGIPLEDLSVISLPHPEYRMEAARAESPGVMYDPNMRVAVQVEREHDESGVSPLPRLSESDEHKRMRSMSQDGGVSATRVGRWR